MGVFSSITKWAKDVWNTFGQVGGTIETVLQSLWQFVGSIYSGLGWIVQFLVMPGYFIVAKELQALFNLHQDLRNALDRVAWWVDTYLIGPLRSDLLFRIVQLELVVMAKFAYLTNLVYILHVIDQSYTDTMVAAERNARVADIKSARAYALALTNQLHQTIESEAVAGYKAGQGIRTSLLEQLADDLNVRGLLDTVTTDLLIKSIDVVMTIDDPALLAVANKIVKQIIAKSGLGAQIGDLIYGLIVPGAGGAAPKNLTGVISDITHRLGVIEDWISNFMLDGGPEIEAVGKQLKTINSLPVDVALLAFVVQAVTSPNTWATEVSDTLGTLANDTIGRIINLIGN